MAKTNRSRRKSRREARPEGRPEEALPVRERVATEVVPYDETLLDRARTQWQMGDWDSLVQLDIENLQHHPQRAKLALLVATGHFQQGDHNEAYRYIHFAEDWGCSRKLIVQMLIAGVHNSLGCADSIIGRHPNVKNHFYHSVDLGGVAGDSDILAQARAAWQRHDI